MKKAVKPLTIISICLIAVGIISAAIIIIFQKELASRLWSAPFDIFIFPKMYVNFTLAEIALFAAALILLRKSAGKTANIISVIISAFLSALSLPMFVINIFDAKEVARKGAESIAMMGALRHNLDFSEQFFVIGFVLLLIAAVISMCENKNEDKEEGFIE